MALFRSPVSIWMLLVALTLMSYISWAESSVVDARLAGTAVLLLAFLKARLIGLHYMELRDGVLPLRIPVRGLGGGRLLHAGRDVLGRRLDSIPSDWSGPKALVLYPMAVRQPPRQRQCLDAVAAPLSSSTTSCASALVNVGRTPLRVILSSTWSGRAVA